MITSLQITLIGALGIIALVISFSLMLFYSEVGKKKTKDDRKKQPSEVPKLNPEKSAELFLEAVLAEYNRLSREIMQHFRNANYIIAVLIGGIVTIFGISGVVGVLSFLLIPIFVSACAILCLFETNVIIHIGKYIREEIEGEKISKLFPNTFPIRWETHYHARYRRANSILMVVFFIISVVLCVGCLILVPLDFPAEISSNFAHLLIYVFGWLISVVYFIFASVLLRRNLLVDSSP